MPEINFSDWTLYFRRNKESLRTIGWDDTYKLTLKEREDVYGSIRMFQKGESSEAKHIFKKAERYLRNREDKSYMTALRLFIDEEHRHSRDLKKIMDLQGIPPLRSHWVDEIFRRLRNLGGIETSITVLLTAEIIATVYYEALKNCTQCGPLRQLCDQILHDEEKHIHFQSVGLSQFYLNRSRFINHFLSLIKMLLLMGTITVTWLTIRRTLRAGGFGLHGFAKGCFSELRKSMAIIDLKMIETRYDLIPYIIK